MKKICLALALVALSSVSFAGIIDEFEIIRRGDANHSGGVDISDVVFLNTHVNYGGNPPPCRNEGDVNADNSININDVTFLINYLYNGGPAPPAPGPFNSTCTSSTTSSLGCGAQDC